MTNTRTLPLDYFTQPYFSTEPHEPYDEPRHDISSYTMTVVVPQAQTAGGQREELRLPVQPRALTMSLLTFLCSQELRWGWRVYCFLTRSPEPGNRSSSPDTYLLVGWVSVCHEVGARLEITLQLDPACEDSLKSFHYHNAQQMQSPKNEAAMLRQSCLPAEVTRRWKENFDDLRWATDLHPLGQKLALGLVREGLDELEQNFFWAGLVEDLLNSHPEARRQARELAELEQQEPVADAMVLAQSRLAAS